MTDTPIIAKKGAFKVELEAGKTYWWCQCGRSQNQPFCDGSHKTTSFKPVKYVAIDDRRALFCGCKHTKNAPFCDSTHHTL